MFLVYLVIGALQMFSDDDDDDDDDDEVWSGCVVILTIFHWGLLYDFSVMCILFMYCKHAVNMCD